MKFTHPFTRRTLQQMARTELDEAERKLMEARSGLEYAASMVQYHTTRRDRLRAQLREDEGTVAFSPVVRPLHQHHQEKP